MSLPFILPYPDADAVQIWKPSAAHTSLFAKWTTSLVSLCIEPHWSLFTLKTSPRQYELLYRSLVLPQHVIQPLGRRFDQITVPL